MDSHHHLIMAGDWISLMAVVGSLGGFLPEAAAGAALIWYCIHIYDYFFREKD
jgi:hypothetical protein